MQAMRNLIIALGHHRDIIDMAFFSGGRDGNKSVDLETGLDKASIVALALRKQWANADSATLVVSQGHLRVPYGFKYHGFGSRLAVTPLTQKYFFAVAQAMKDLSIPIICGHKGSGRSSLTKELAFETGRELLEFDCATALTSADLERRLQVAVGCALWVNFSNITSLRDKPSAEPGVCMLDRLQQQVRDIQLALGEGVDKITVGGATLIVKAQTGQAGHGTGTGTAFTFNMVCANPPHPSSYLPVLPDVGVDADMSRRFRPLFVWGPQRPSMVRLLLLSCAPHLTTDILAELVARFEAFCVHMERTEPQVGPVVTQMLVRVIRTSGHLFGTMPNEAIVKAGILGVARYARGLWLDTGRSLAGSAHLPAVGASAADWERGQEADVLLPDSQLKLLLNVFADAPLYASDLEDANLGSRIEDGAGLHLSPAEQAVGAAVHAWGPGAVVVGPMGTGKTSLIRGAMARLEGSGAWGFGIKERFGAEVQYRAHSRVLSAAALESVALCDFPQVLDTLLGKLVGAVSDGVTLMVHVDAPSSRALLPLLSYARERSEQRGTCVKLLVEVPELTHLGPSEATSLSLVSVGHSTVQRTRPSAVVEAWVARLCGSGPSGDARPLATHAALRWAVDALLAPILSLVDPSDPMLEESPWLVEHVFQLMEVLLDAAATQLEAVMPAAATGYGDGGDGDGDASTIPSDPSTTTTTTSATATATAATASASVPGIAALGPAVDDMSLARVVVFAAHVVCASEAVVRSVSGGFGRTCTHASQTAAFPLRVRSLMDVPVHVSRPTSGGGGDSESTSFEVLLGESRAFPPDWALGDYYLQVDSSGAADELYSWRLWHAGADRAVDDVEDVPLYAMPAHMLAPNPRQLQLQQQAAMAWHGHDHNSAHVMAPGLWDPVSDYRCVSLTRGTSDTHTP